MTFKFVLCYKLVKRTFKAVGSGGDIKYLQIKSPLLKVALTKVLQCDWPGYSNVMVSIRVSEHHEGVG